MKKKILLASSVLVLVLVIFLGYRTASEKVNTLFPLDVNDVFDVCVEEAFSESVYSRSCTCLRGEKANIIIDALNQLELSKEERELVRYSNELGQVNVLYEIHINFDHTKNKLRYWMRREGGCTLYVLDSNRIIAFYGGYEYYDDTSEYYDDLLILLDEYKDACLNRIELEDGTIFTSYEDYHAYVAQQVK